jgi:hypothetical protein
MLERMMALRDISQDLKERLSMIEEQAKAENNNFEQQFKKLEDSHNAKMAELRMQWEGINAALQAEFRRLGVNADSPSPPKPALSLDDFFVQLVEKFGTAGKENLRAEAANAGYFPPGDKGGRTTHATLMNIVRAGRIREISSEVYAPAHDPGEFQRSLVQ